MDQSPTKFYEIYRDNLTVAEKINRLKMQIYIASGVECLASFATMSVIASNGANIDLSVLA